MNKPLAIALVMTAVSLPKTSLADLSFTIGSEPEESSKLFEVNYAIKFNNYIALVPSAGVITPEDFWSTPFGVGELALRVRLEVPWFYASFSQGAAVVSRTDRFYLTSHLQLPTTASVGLRHNKAYLGFTFKHYSNGGFQGFNEGKNFSCVEFGGIF